MGATLTVPVVQKLNKSRYNTASSWTTNSPQLTSSCSTVKNTQRRRRYPDIPGKESGSYLVLNTTTLLVFLRTGSNKSDPRTLSRVVGLVVASPHGASHGRSMDRPQEHEEANRGVTAEASIENELSLD